MSNPNRPLTPYTIPPYRSEAQDEYETKLRGLSRGRGLLGNIGSRVEMRELDETKDTRRDRVLRRVTVNADIHARERPQVLYWFVGDDASTHVITSTASGTLFDTAADINDFALLKVFYRAGAVAATLHSSSAELVRGPGGWPASRDAGDAANGRVLVGYLAGDPITYLRMWREDDRHIRLQREGPGTLHFAALIGYNLYS